MKLYALLVIICTAPICITCVRASGTEPLVVKANKIYKSSSNVVWAGKGVNLPDMRACLKNGCERSTEELIRRVDYLFDEIGLDWIRFLLEAYDASNTILSNSTYWEDVLRVVDYIGSKPGKYVEVTLFADPSIGADPDVPGGPSSSTADKWTFMARQFKDMPHVIMGIVNEPQGFQSTPGRDISLRNSMNYVANKIRETGAQNLILVQCLAFSADCNLYVNNKISAANVAYELHLYCTTDEADTKLSLDLPFVVSEIGIINEPDEVIVENYLSFRYIVSLCQRRKIPYAGWCFDENCAPVMLEGQTTSDNGCGAGNDLSSHTTWGRLFLDNVPCDDEFCDGASAPVPALGPVPQISLPEPSPAPSEQNQEPAPGPASQPMVAPAPVPEEGPSPAPVPTPTPTPTATGGGSGCIGAHQIVTLESGKTKILKDLTLGDKVLTGNGFQDYIGNIHAGVVLPTLVLYTNDGYSVEVTSDHLVKITGGYMRADQISIDDTLVARHGSTKVAKINQGMSYVVSPFTRSGTIVVNDIILSCFGNTFSHYLANMLYIPVRIGIVRDVNKYFEALEKIYNVLPLWTKLYISGDTRASNVIN